MTGTRTSSSAVGFGGGRMSRQRKRDAVLRLLRGEDLETVSRSLGVTAATLTARRDSFLAAGEAALAARLMDGETLESERLKARLGDMLLKHELLEQKITTLEGGRLLPGLARGQPELEDGSPRMECRQHTVRNHVRRSLRRRVRLSIQTLTQHS